MGFSGTLLRAISRRSAAARRHPALSHPLQPLPHRTPFSRVSTAGAAAGTFCQPIIRPPWGVFAAHFNSLTFRSLTDTRFPKRRPGEKPRKKRAALKPKGPFVWIQSVPGEPLPTSQPNEGSIKARGRNRKKRIAQRKAFIAAEVKKRKEAFKEHKRKKGIEKIERKMAAVAREKAWAERLIELQQLEEAKKAARA